MAPLASEPRQLLVVLNIARRKALYTLLSEITAYMRSQLELKDEGHDSDWDNLPTSGGRKDSSRAGAAASRDTPLFAPPNRRGSSYDGDDDDDGFDDESARAAASSSAQAMSEAQRNKPPGPELIKLRKAALAQFDGWRRPVLAKLKEVLSAPDDAAVLEERRKRGERIAEQRAAATGRTPSRPFPDRKGSSHSQSLLDIGSDDAADPAADEREEAERTKKAVAALQALYHPIPTRLTTIPVEDRRETLSAVLVLLLSMGNYSAHARVLVVYLASALDLPLSCLVTEETEIAKSLVETSSQQAQDGKGAGGSSSSNIAMSADAEARRRQEENRSSRLWKVGLASVAGAAVIGITGGLAAPVVAGAIGGLMGTVGLGSLASFLGIFWMNGALVGTLFGAFGASMTGEMVDQYAREVEDFRFVPLKDEWGRDCRKDASDTRRLRVTIGVNGWLTTKEDVTKPWRCLGDDSEVFALRYEMKSLLALGKSLQGLVSSYAWSYVKAEILRRTVLATLWSALWPAYLLSLASSIDNPFHLARNRSDKAGRILADALINRAQGERPVTLVGYSLGARVVYACLRSLAARRAFGLVDTVVLIGAPVPSSRAHFQAMRSVVSGRVFNVYSENDFILAFLYRATSMQLGIAGLQAVRDVDGVENLDLSAAVKGHLRYPDLTARILARCGFPDTVGGDRDIEPDEDDEAGGGAGDLINLDDLAISEPQSKAPEPVQVTPLRKTPREALPPYPGQPLGEPEQKSDIRLDSRPEPNVAGRENVIDQEPVKPKSEKKLVAQKQEEEEEDEDEDEDYVGVQMEDHDDDYDEDLGEMVTYAAPIPLDD